VQLAACNLTIGAPDTDYARINLYTLPHGPVAGKNGDKPNEVRHGALEKLFDEKKMAQMVMMPPPPLYGSSVARKEVVELKVPEEYDAVVFNPPFTDTQKQAKRYSAATTRAMRERLLSIRTDLEKRDSESAKAIAKRSIRPFFTPLATRLSKNRGKLAKVVPVTTCTSENGRAERQYIADNFHVEMVVTSHDPKHVNFSENTAVHECLLIGKRGAGNDKPTRFIQLAEYPGDVNAADQLIAAIENGDGVDMTYGTPPPRENCAFSDSGKGRFAGPVPVLGEQAACASLLPNANRAHPHLRARHHMDAGPEQTD